MIQAPPTLAANLKWLFSEWPLAERFGAAAACGFRAIELSLPYALPIRQLRQSLEQHQLTYAYLLAAAGDWDAGDRGLACVPGRQAEFRDGVRQAIEYASALGGPLVHAAAGVRPDGADPAECQALLVENLRWACRAAAEHGLRVVLEPVCRRDYPRYCVPNLATAQRVLADVGAANFGLVLDLHHVQWEEG
ncbi:MAG TPA: TIM barrel protein, partial [Ramlibacter sp.]|nr:TIM barrel protein [Ramlibacter sp.]